MSEKTSNQRQSQGWWSYFHKHVMATAALYREADQPVSVGINPLPHLH